MKIQKIRINDIKPAHYNPRHITDEEFQKLTNSLDTYGLVDPIIINLKNNTIIGGHQRYKVLLSEYEATGMFEELTLFPRGDIGWVFTDTDLTIENESYEKGLNIALNKISGEWDYPKLNNIIDDLLTDETFDINLTGFDDLDMESLNKNPEIEEQENNNNGFNEPYGSNRLGMIINCKDENEMNIIYSRLTEEGYDVKVK